MDPEKCEARCADDREQGSRVLDPEDRMPVQQNVAKRAASDRGDGCEHQNTEQVELGGHGCESSARGEYCYTEEVEDVQQHGVKGA